MCEECPEEAPPREVWLVRPKSDARYYMVCESRVEAASEVESRAASGATMAGPYMLATEQANPKVDE